MPLSKGNVPSCWKSMLIIILDFKLTTNSVVALVNSIPKVDLSIQDMIKAGCTTDFIRAYRLAHDLGAKRVLFWAT